MMGWVRNLTLTMAVVAWLWVAGTAAAQDSRQLPFSSTYSRPVISPYNQIYNFASNPMQSQNIYQQLVKPQVQQEQQREQQLLQGRQINKMQNQVKQLQRDTSARQTTETIRPTGHASTYQNLSHFYPASR